MNELTVLLIFRRLWEGNINKKESVVLYYREIPFEPEDPSRDNVESPRLAKGKESW